MIFLLHGPESFRRQQKLKELKDKFINTLDPLGQSLSFLDGSKCSLTNLNESLNSASLFTKKRMLIIENIFLNQQENIFPELLKLCQKNTGNDDNIIIFNEEQIKKTALKSEVKKFADWLFKQPYVQEFKALNNIQLASFVREKMTASKSSISNSALNLLISKTGNDLWRLNNEINKLIATTNKKIISDDLVNELVVGEIENNIFALVDALVVKKNELAIRLLEEQLSAGLSVEYILAMLQRQIKIMLSIKIMQNENNLSQNDIVKKLKLHPFVVQKASQQAKNFSLDELHAFWQSLLEIDFNNKKGKSDIINELYALLIKA